MDSDDDMQSLASSADFNDDAGIGSDISLEDAASLGGYGEPEAAFDMHDKDFAVKKKSYETDYKVYSPEDIQKSQQTQVDEVAMITDLPPEAAAILLRHARWHKEKLIERYMEDQEKVLDEAGIGSSSRSTPPKIKKVANFTCQICYDDSPNLDTFAMKCNHRFCVDCYKHYVTQKISEEGEAARIKCPGDDCKRIIDSKSLELLLKDESSLRDRYQELLTRTYVDDKDNLKWCPAPNCVYAVSCGVKPKDLMRVVPTVACKCHHRFCFGCTLPDHQPAPCALVKKWIKKCEDDSETANWISANTKECPKCMSTIEKNGGCNHMTCRKCKNEFCWMCMGVWSEHGTSWYNCSRFDEKSGHEARDQQAKSRASLERYLHYFNRFANHQQSAKLDKDIALKAEKKMSQLQTNSNLSWIEVQFISNASQTLQQCRQTLKWTYALAYYLARTNKTILFEDNQRDLEMAVEDLSHLFELATEDLGKKKIEMLDRTTYCNKRREIMLSTTADELAVGGWEFNTDLTR